MTVPRRPNFCSLRFPVQKEGRTTDGPAHFTNICVETATALCVW